ncbi:hypothetical protein FQV26_07860 [Planococcus sp. CPCC 101016]|uniref:hypothetical protein n=1 Tax=Planococcus sp. CPCC 101016 TaxID=2599617 RepID=UPI0011B6B133|nr:hypothetical protein [Planococcus sp. CPCC 101016]TWT07715.1 hypothetical protein FQV26_07860 [Planococcus sp. CPCC 101016]
MIVFLSGSEIFLNSLEKNQLLHGMLIEVFEHDPKVQLDRSRGDTTITADEFATDLILFAKDILMYPFYLIIFSILFSLMGLITTYVNPMIAVIFLTLAGVLSLFTLLPPILLFLASNTLQKELGHFHTTPHRKVI